VSVVGLIQQAREAGIAVVIDGGKLVVRGPRSAKELAALLWQHKAEVMAALANVATPTEPVIPAAVTLRLSPNDRDKLRGALAELVAARQLLEPDPDSAAEIDRPGDGTRAVDGVGTTGCLRHKC
jgi:hypothetical protein